MFTINLNLLALDFINLCIKIIPKAQSPGSPIGTWPPKMAGTLCAETQPERESAQKAPLACRYQLILADYFYQESSLKSELNVVKVATGVRIALSCPWH